MTTYVVDASVAAKWCLPPVQEEYVDQAVYFLTAYLRSQIKLVIPDFFFAEFGNVLWKAVRRGRLPASEVGSAIALIEATVVPVVASGDLLREALNIALKYDRSVYDCLYIALAQRAEAEFITADERLANAVGGQLPVRWLGAF